MGPPPAQSSTSAGRAPTVSVSNRGLAVLTLLALAAAPALAQEQAPRAPRVRPERGVQRLVDDAARRSPAIRASIDRLEALDVTVYIRAKWFVQLELDGRVALLSTTGSRRDLVIELVSRPSGS